MLEAKTYTYEDDLISAIYSSVPNGGYWLTIKSKRVVKIESSGVHIKFKDFNIELANKKIEEFKQLYEGL